MSDSNQWSISAIIPSYNSASVLPAAIKSVLTQTKAVREIIVVDDGSNDDTAAVCNQYATVTYIRQQNGGASAARNRGAEIATGQWLAFLDADDVWIPGKIERQLEALRTQSNATVCMTGANVWSAATKSWHDYSYRGSTNRKFLQRQLLVRNVLSGICSSLLINRDAFDAVGGFAAGKCCEDRRIAIDLLEKFDLVVIREPLIQQQPGPAHFTNPERHRREMIDLVRDYDSLYAKLDPTGMLKMRAISRIHERSGMHYLENGDISAALYDMIHAAIRWPFQPNPWRVLINTAVGRAIKKPSKPNSSTRQSVQPVA